MPRIELVLPGESRKTPAAVAKVYRITVERDDDLACTDIEARTAIHMLYGVSPEKPPKDWYKSE